MRSTVTVKLPKEMIKRVDSLTKKEYVNRDDVVREALRQYLVQREFDRIRKRMIPQARRQGIFTDEDVFRIVS